MHTSESAHGGDSDILYLAGALGVQRFESFFVIFQLIQEGKMSLN